MKNLTIEKCIDLDLWNDFIENSNQGTPFLKTDFLLNFSSKFELWFVKENDLVLAGFPIMFEKNKLILKPIEYLPYMSPVLSKYLDDSKNHKKFKKIVDILSYGIENLNKLFPNLTFVTHPNLKDMRPFLWHNYGDIKKNKFVLELNYTSVINFNKFQNFEEYLISIRSVRRQEFNRIKKSKTKIYKSTKIDDISSFVNLYKLTFERQNIKLNSKEIEKLTSILKKCLINRIGYFLFSIQPNNYISSAIFIISDSNTMYYYFSATDPNYRSSGDNTFLLLNAIKDGFSSKFKYFDFLGVNSPNRGDFKLSFNGDLKSYYNLILNN